MNSQRHQIKKQYRRERFIELLLPVHVVSRELRKYNEREEKAINPVGHTWPTPGRAANTAVKKKTIRKDMTRFIIKFKRREQWERLKAELGKEYLERVHFSSLQNIAQTGQSFNLNGHSVQPMADAFVT